MTNAELQQGISSLFEKIKALESENKRLTMKNEGLRKQVESNYSSTYIKTFFKENVPVIDNITELQILYIAEKYSDFLNEAYKATTEVGKEYQEVKKDTPLKDRDKLFFQYFYKYLTQ